MPKSARDARERLLGERGVAALGDLVEVAPDVAPAVGKRHRTAVASGIGQRVVGRVGVDLENAAEPRERPDGMLGAAAGGVEIDHGGRIGTGPGPVVARDRPEIAGLGPPAPRVEHRRPGLVHEQLGRAFEVLEQTLVQRAELGGGAPDPVREGRAIELDALAGVDLALPIERQVVGVLRDQHMGDERLGRQPALDQSRRCRRLDHGALARPAAVLGPAGDDHPELRRDDVEPLRDVLADPVQRAATARAGRARRLDHHLVARQVLGQRPAIDTALLPARRLQRRVALLRRGLALGQRLLDVLERELQLIGIGGLLGAPPEQGPLQLLDDRPQLLVVPGELGRPRPFGQQQRLEHRHVVGQRGGFGGLRRRAHGGSGSHRRRLVIH